jgi:hypothetical protein
VVPAVVADHRSGGGRAWNSNCPHRAYPSQVRYRKRATLSVGFLGIASRSYIDARNGPVGLRLLPPDEPADLELKTGDRSSQRRSWPVARGGFRKPAPSFQPARRTSFHSLISNQRAGWLGTHRNLARSKSVLWTLIPERASWFSPWEPELIHPCWPRNRQTNVWLTSRSNTTARHFKTTP